MEYTLKANGVHVLELIKKPETERRRGGQREREIKREDKRT